MRTYLVKNEAGEKFEVDENKINQAEKDGYYPVVSNGKDEQRVPFTKLSLAKNDGYKPVAPAKEFGLAGAARNIAQGATAGFSDELSGGLEALGTVVGVKGLGGKIKNIGLSDEGPTLNANTISEAYRRGQQGELDELKSDAESNPKASFASQVAGGFLSPINKIKYLQKASALKSGAILGGVTGLGMSEGDNLVDVGTDVVLGAAGGAALGKAASKVGDFVGAGFSKLADKTSPAKRKANFAEILNAAKKLNIKVTPAMLDDTGFVQRLEDALAKSPSILGQSVARNQQNVTKGLSQAGQELTENASNLTPFEMGEKFKSGVTAKIGERLDPIAALFSEVADSTKNIPIGEKSAKRIINNIEKDDLYSLGIGSATAKKYVDAIPNLKNANQVKSLMTALNSDYRSAQGADRQVLGMIKDKLSRLESNSIIRGAIEAAKQTGSGQGSIKPATGEKIGKEIVSDLLEARKAYAGLAGDVSEVAKNARIKTKNPNSFLNYVEEIPSEKIQDKFFNKENLKQLQNLKDTFPDEFNLLKSGKLKDILEESIDNTLNGNGELASARFLKAVRNLNPEVQDLIFGSGVDTIKNMQTLQNALPKNFNPSGTASTERIYDAIYSNIKDIPTYLLYRGASSNLAENITNNLIKNPKIFDIYKTNPQVVQSFAQRLETQAGGVTKNEKTPDRWVASASKKIQSVDKEIDDDIVMKYAETEEGKNELIKATSEESLKSLAEKIKSSPAYQDKLLDKMLEDRNYPKILRKENKTVVVKSDQELIEAVKEGWK